MSNPATTDNPAATEKATPAARSKRAGSAATGAVQGTPTTGRFYVCVAVLVVAALTMQGLATALQAYFRKEPVPLRKPLYLLDKSKLGPEYKLHQRQPEPIDHETIENLGTEEYLQWNLVDQRQDPSNRAAVARLFVTYHTGTPDMVPHNPKECIAAGGSKLIGEEKITVRVAHPQGGEVEIPVSVLSFAVTQRANTLLPDEGSPTLVVAYFFWANGEYVTSRMGVRKAVANPWDRYAYYTKVEVSFTDERFQFLADRAETIAGVERLLRKLMPILWQDHYQDWEAIKNGAKPVVDEG